MVDVNLGNVRGLQGLPGATGNGIRSIEKTGTSGKVDTYTITYDNGSTKTFTVTNGSDGSTVSFTRTLSSGTKLGTITINGVSTDLYCSSGGSADIVTSWEQLLSDVKVPSEKLTKNTIDTKQDVLVSGTNIKTVNGNSIMGSGDLEVGSNAGTFTDLQSLITSATSGDIIVLDKDYKYNGTTDSSLSDGVVINKIITLIGNGHIIDANNSRKAFSINDSQYGLTLIDLVIQNGSNFGESGGAIYNEGTLIIRDCDFRNNIADSAGAIYTASGSVLNISNSSFMYNTANGEHTGGGAIKSYGDLTITNSVFTQNEAYECGAIDSRSTFSLKNSTVKSNDATYHANIYSASSVIAYGCDLSDGASTYTNITNKPYLTDGVEVGSFTDLQELISDADDGDTIILDKDYKYDSTIDSNITTGIPISKNITLIGNGHIIDGYNNVRIFKLDANNLTFNLYNIILQNGNASGANGGAIFLMHGIVNVFNVIFNNNTANYGGAIAVVSSTSTVLNMMDCSFNGNTATYYDDVHCMLPTTVYNCIISDISTSCYNVTNITTESLNNSIRPLLESGTNIKTINNESLLGSGNISVGGGSSVDIVTSWESTLSDTKVPSEKLTKETIDTKISKSNTAGLVKNDGTIDTTTKLTASDIVDNLTTSDATKVLSAKQGKALNDLIGSAIAYINL